MLKRSKPMKRTAFKSKGWAPRPTKVIDYTPTPRAPVRLLLATDGAARLTIKLPRPCPKDDAIQDERYMALVRLLPCARCGKYREGLIQFCHADNNGGRGGKGLGIKSDCRMGWPGCGPDGDNPGCHWFVGTSGRMPKAERRTFEAGAGADTRLFIFSAGLWPRNVPLWPGDQFEALEPETEEA